MSNRTQASPLATARATATRAEQAYAKATKRATDAMHAARRAMADQEQARAKATSARARAERIARQQAEAEAADA